MTQHEVEAVQFWLDITKRNIKVTEKVIKICKNKLIEMLDADIDANTELLRQNWSAKRLQIIGFMQSLRDALERI
jgi:hypothetical protein